MPTVKKIRNNGNIAYRPIIDGKILTYTVYIRIAISIGGFEADYRALEQNWRQTGIQEAQLPQRNSASAAHVYLAWLTDRATHRTPQNRRGCIIF